MNKPLFKRLLQPYTLSAISFLLALCVFAIMLYVTPFFGGGFWLQLGVFTISLLTSFGSLSLGLLRSARIWLKLLAFAPASLGIGTILGATFLSYSLVRDGASIHSFSSMEDSRTGSTHIGTGDREISIGYMKLSSRAEQPASPIVYLSGGPGGSGTVSMYAYGRYSLFQALRSVSDVIVYDQRGTMPWAGDWMICADPWTPDWTFTPESLVRNKIERTRACYNKYLAKGVDPAAYNTINNAEDLESLRKHLGVDKLNLWATSYGTHLALTYMKRYPLNVDKAILHGTEGLDDTLKTPVQIQAALEKVSQLASRDPDISAHLPDLLAAIERLLARADKGELILNPEPTSNSDSGAGKPLIFSKWELQFYLSEMLRTASSSLAIPAHVYAALQGDMRGFEGWARSMRKEQPRVALMPTYMDCASYASAERLALIAEQAPKTLLGDAINFSLPQLCAGIDAPVLGDDFRAPFSSDIPTLFISGDFDARTPIDNAKRAAQDFRNAHHLIIQGAGHGNDLFLSSDEILENMLMFFRTAEVKSTIIFLKTEVQQLNP